jgi:hypothetical protein
MQYLQIIFLAAFGSYFGYVLGKYAAGIAEMCFGEKLVGAPMRHLKTIVRWGVLAFTLVGALSLAVH